MEIQVIDKENGRMVWQEPHETEAEVNKAINELQENNFNPEYFIYKIKN